MEPVDTFILFGKKLFTDNGLDWIAQARCDLAISLLKQNPSAELIITGGPTTSEVSEASVMSEYVREKLPADTKIILEETGTRTIQQLLLLKNEYLAPQKKFNIGLVSDEFHLPRIELIAKHLFGDDFTVSGYKAEVRISGRHRQSIADFENELLDLSTKNPILSNFPKGDDEAWRLYDEYYENKKVELDATKLDVNEEFLQYINNQRNQQLA